MKRIYILIAITILTISCKKVENIVELPQSQNGLIVNVIPQGLTTMQTRANFNDPDNQINSLYILVFNENGNFISLHEGRLISTNTTQLYLFNGLGQSDSKDRTLHFIANYDWSTFSSYQNIGKNESEVINTLSTTNNTQIFWQKVLIPGGFNTLPGNTYQIQPTINLLRNKLKISVNNNTTIDNTYYITDYSYALGDYLDKGSVAPFNTSNGLFEQGNITEAKNGEVQLIQSKDFSNVPITTYERKNSTAKRHTYIILKAKYVKEGESIPAKYSYYKVDITDSNADKLMDLERNFHYIININKVLKDGYPTMELAVQNAASNNINASVAVAEYTSVSNGVDVLNVENTTFTYVTPNKPFTIEYSYLKGIPGVEDNSGVIITLEQDGANPVVKGNISYNTTSPGRITGTTADIKIGHNVNIATITISKGELKRKITLKLRAPMNFANASIFTPFEGKIANLVAQPCIITFKLPADIPNTAYPIPIYIYSKKLSPDPISENSSSISVDASPSAEYRYVYMAPNLGKDENNQMIPHYIQFVSNSTNSTETIRLESDLFASTSLKLNTINTIEAISNLGITPNPAPQKIGEQITVKFTIPNVSYTSAPYSIRIFTSKLDFESTTSGESCVWDNNIKAYIYTTNKTGEQTIIFKTKTSDNTEVIRIGSDKFGYISGSRTN